MRCRFRPVQTCQWYVCTKRLVFPSKYINQLQKFTHAIPSTQVVTQIYNFPHSFASLYILRCHIYNDTVCTCRCTGGESELAECGCSTGRTAEQCGHKGDVGVECHAPQQCNTDTCNVSDISALYALMYFKVPSASEKVYIMYLES